MKQFVIRMFGESITERMNELGMTKTTLIEQASAHELLTQYIRTVADENDIPCERRKSRGNHGWTLPRFEIHCKNAIATALGLPKIIDIEYEMLADAEHIVDVIADVYVSWN